MNVCKACRTHIGAGFAACPVCGMLQENYDETAAFYPKTKQKKGIFFWRRLAIAMLCLGCFSACIVNLAVGGVPWAMYVVLGAYTAYVLFLSLETAEISLIRRIVSGCIAVSLLLYGIEYITQSGTWATEIVIPLVLFAGLAASTVLYFSAFRRYSGQFLPMLGLALSSLLAAVFGICGILPMRWPLITLSGFAFAASIAVLVTFRKTLCAEFKKKLHR